jgi:protein gp37
MGKDTAISWADATWNPWYGCTKVSPACENCYAEAWAKRCGRDFSKVTRSKDATFYAPLKWKDPRRIFVCSLSDVFHPHTDMMRGEAFNVMLDTPQHTYLLLTKRPERLHDHSVYPLEVLPNVWLGVTAENQEQADKRVPLLVETPAVMRFVSIEPMLGPVSLRQWFYEPTGKFRTYKGRRQLQLRYNPQLDWVIVGGESGPNRRPMKIEWLEDIVEQCKAANVPVFVKQGNAFRAGQQGDIPDHLWKIKEFPK